MFRDIEVRQAVLILLVMFSFAAGSCVSVKHDGDTSTAEVTEGVEKRIPEFNADSAYYYVKRQVESGPRIPNTSSHKNTGDWLASQLRKRGAEVLEQCMTLTAFDGTRLESRNIFASFNPDAEQRTLLLAHWDCRPWSDQDPDPSRRHIPVDGANDGASGVGVLLELARLLGTNPLPAGKGVDILFVDAEDWGTDDREDSWALGTHYFVQNPILPGYRPSRGILLDMVGSGEATFYKEYFSELAAPDLNAEIWSIASSLGFDSMFIPRVGSAVTDDHRPLIDAGIPTIDIIDYRLNQGFDPTWHTSSDNMDNISRNTLGAVGKVLTHYLWK